MIVAVDPGASGGIAILREDHSVISTKMPETDKDIIDWIQNNCGVVVIEKKAVIEKVNGFIGEGQPGSAMFTFGDNCGFIRGVIMTMHFSVELMRPQDWQKILGLGNREHARCVLHKGSFGYDEEKKKVSLLNAQYKRNWKNKLKEKAQQLFPSQKVTLANADALLILEAFRRIQKIV
jgi:hypothetical protein